MLRRGGHDPTKIFFNKPKSSKISLFLILKFDKDKSFIQYLRPLENYISKKYYTILWPKGATSYACGSDSDLRTVGGQSLV